jgi:hypothetical protein
MMAACLVRTQTRAESSVYGRRVTSEYLSFVRLSRKVRNNCGLKKNVMLKDDGMVGNIEGMETKRARRIATKI